MLDPERLYRLAHDGAFAEALRLIHAHAEEAAAAAGHRLWRLRPAAPTPTEADFVRTLRAVLATAR